MLKKVLLSAAVIASFGYATQVNAQTCTNPLTVTITGSSSGIPLTVTGSVTSNYNGAQVSCGDPAQGITDNGIITAVGAGGSTPYQYSIDGGPFQSSDELTGLSAGPHVITVKDANNCIATSSTIEITAPDPISAGTCTLAQDLCQVNSGSVKVEATGGTGALNATWSASANFPFTGIPGGSPAGNVPTPVPATYTGLSGNSTYFFQVTDANGCVAQ